MSNPSKIKLSIIEDSEIHREWLKVELNNNPQVQIVSIDHGGRKGIESVKLHNPDIVMLDFQLEDMTGLEVSKRIKLYNENIKLRILSLKISKFLKST